MKVVVFDVAASTGGALSVLKSFYEAAKVAKGVRWVFILSAHHLEETDNIEVKSYSWIKKSRLHRLCFDYIVAPSVVKNEKPDCVLSLQNTNIPFVKNRQIVYLHQSIPFCDIQFSLRKNPVEWLYQNVIGRFIFKSIRKANTVVVQTNWMKEAVMEKTGIPAERILVTPPMVNTNYPLRHIYSEETRKRFFYPAAYVSYKNHSAIIRAAELLCQEGIGNFQVIFTVNSCGNLPEQVEKQIQCIGTLPFEEVQKKYTQCVLLFPSLLETFGLPLAEAAMLGTPVVAADKPYAREVLSDYNNAEFFDPHKPEQLAAIMKRHICGTYHYQETDDLLLRQKYSGTGWDLLIQYITENQSA